MPLCLGQLGTAASAVDAARGERLGHVAAAGAPAHRIPLQHPLHFGAVLLCDFPTALEGLPKSLDTFTVIFFQLERVVASSPTPSWNAWDWILLHDIATAGKTL
jgi:hypothetical protein